MKVIRNTNYTVQDSRLSLEYNKGDIILRDQGDEVAFFTREQAKELYLMFATLVQDNGLMDEESDLS